MIIILLSLLDYDINWFLKKSLAPDLPLTHYVTTKMTIHM